VRATTAAAVSLLCALVVVPWAAAGVDDASRAVASYVAMERYLFDARSGTYREIFFRRLLELAAVDRRQSYVDAAETYGTNAWNSLRDPQTGLFAFPGSEDLLVQASFVQLYAELATFTGTQAAS
jgi:hypothetical protein